MSKVKELIKYFDGYGSPYDSLIVALAEKQMLKKINGIKTKIKAVDIESREIHTYNCFPCPSCEKWITKIYNFCPHCGQRIKE